MTLVRSTIGAVPLAMAKARQAAGMAIVAETVRTLAALAPPLAFSSPPAWRAIDASAYTMSASDETRVDSVHGVKGESIDAVMLVAEAPKQGRHTPQARQRAAVLTSGQALAEEDRILYVALTRAQRLLVLALPDSTPSGTVDAFVGAGFEVRES